MNFLPALQGLVPKVLFLDRDGVVNRERGDYTYKPEDFIINAGLIDFLKIISNKEIKIIIISNQGGIAKGIYTKNDVETLHRLLINQFKENGVEILEIYYCPHHQNYTKCLCRKPSPLMIEKSLARFGIEKQNAFLIGDAVRDIEAAKNAGIEALKVEPNQNLMNFVDEILTFFA